MGNGTRKTNEQIVDHALDAYVAARRKRSGIDPDGFQARTLAAVAKVSRSIMSDLLQQYRLRQRDTATRYVIAAQGYGRVGRWHILALPGSDPQVVQDARRQAALWSAHDARDRFLRDYVCEVYPGLKGTQVDQAIEATATHVGAQIDLAVANLDRQLAIIVGGTP